MTRSARRLGLALVVVAIVFAVAVAYALWPTHSRAIAANSLIAGDAASIERGRYLAVAADCAACHTAAGGRDFAGGRPLASPLGAIYSTNITPDRETGIGGLTLDQFDRAVRRGIGKSGGTLYPAMPYPSYSRMRDADVADLYNYFMHGVDPVSGQSPPNDLPWPLSVRWPVALWRKLFAPAADAPAFDASRFADPALARGAYLVEGPGHCGACHTPRGFFLQEKALDQSSELYLAGGQVIDGWVAVNLRGNAADGLGSWSQDDIVATLRQARNTEHAVIGAAMGEVVLHSTQYLTAEDLQAMASYLKTLPATRNSVSAFTANPATAVALASAREVDRGAELYLDNCSACHRTTGSGNANVFPEIAGNSSVLSPDPASLIRLVLQGSSLPRTTASPSALGMPGFAWRLSNAEVAQLLTFIRNSWGNRAPGVSPREVAHVRAALQPATTDGRSHCSGGAGNPGTSSTSAARSTSTCLKSAST
jgi:mono/diheme cytochrome c family protein